MTLQASGQISISDLDNQLRKSGQQLNFSDSRVRGLAQVGSGPISISNFYSKFEAFTVTAYGIGGGGAGHTDTSGGGGGGGAVVKQFTLYPNGPTTCTVIVGGGGQLQNGSGGTSYLTAAGIGLYAYGGSGNPYGPPCGNCLGGRGVSGGGASGGDLNLNGGGGSGWNQYYVDYYTAYDGKGNPYQASSYNQYPGFDGQAGALNGVTYYAAGGGGGGSDLVGSNPGGNGGYYAGHGGTGVHSGGGGAGSNYGGGGGGGGNYGGGGPCTGAQGVFVISYASPFQRATGGSISFDGTTWTHVFTSSDYFTPY